MKGGKFRMRGRWLKPETLTAERSSESGTNESQGRILALSWAIFIQKSSHPFQLFPFRSAAVLNPEHTSREAGDEGGERSDAGSIADEETLEAKYAPLHPTPYTLHPGQ